MSVIDSGVVQLIFDNSQFEGNVKNSISSLKDLKNNMDMTDSAKSLKALDTGVKGFKFTAMSNGVQEVKKQFNALETVASTAMARITNSVMTAGKNLVSSFTTKPIVDGFNEMQMQIGSIQTILANTQSKGTTLDQVNSALDELNTYADKTIYNFTEMTQNIGRFTAAGVDLKKSVSSIKGIANLAALSGSTPDQASRAMYQLSQAIAAGKVNLMDWNSVVNAGMGGETFQNALTRTAAAMNGFGDNIEGFKKKYWGGAKSFRESISGKDNSGWLTTDVLTETFKQFANDESAAELKTKGFTDKQIKEIQQLGHTAEESATKVRTFKQMFDALSEAAGSGWTHTWQGVIGNFQESSDLLSNINDVLSKTIQKSANARNAVVDRWRALGGRDALIGAGSNIWKTLSSIGDRISKARQAIFPNLNGDYFNHLSHQLQNFTAKMKPSEETLDKISNTAKGFFSIIDIGLQPIKALGKGAVDLIKYFAPASKGILSLTSDFGKFFTTLDQNLKDSKFFDKIVQTGVKGIEKGADTVKGFFKGFASGFDKSSFSWLTDGVKNISSTLSKAFSKIKIPKNFSSFVDSLQKLVKSIGSGLGKGLSGIGKALGNIGDIGKGLGKGVSSIGKFFDNIFANADGKKGGQRIYDAFENIGKGLGSMFHSVSDGVKGFDTGKMSDILAQFSIIGTSLLTGRAVNTFTSFGASLKKSSKDVMESAKGGFGIKDFLGNISDSIKKFGNKDTDKLKAISVAVGVLAGSLVALGMIKPERMSQAIGGMSAIFLELTGAMKMIDKLSPDKAGTRNLNRLIIFFNGIAIAVRILAGAMKKLGSIENIDSAVTGLTAIFMNLLVFEGVLNEFAKKSKNGSAIQKGMGQLLVLSGAIAILAQVVKELGMLSDTQLGNGLLGLAGITGIVTAFEGILKIMEMISSLGGSNNTGVIQKGMEQLVILGVAIKILASVVKELGAMDMGSLGTGLLGTGSIAGILAGFEALMACISKINDVKAGDVAGAVLTMGTMVLAVKSLSKVVAAMGQLDMGTLLKGTISTAAIAGIIAGFEAILAAINKIDTKGRNIAGSVATMITLAAVIKALSKVVQALGEMSTGALAKGLIGTAGIGAILSFCTGFITKLNTLDTKGKNIVGSIATLLALTAAIKGISKVVQDLGSMSMPDLGKGLLGLAGGLTAIMSALEAFKSISTGMSGLDTLKGLASLAGIVTSLTVLTGLFKAFNGIKWSSIAKGFTAFGGAIAGLAIAGMALSPVIDVLEKFSTVILKIGAGVGIATAGIAALVTSLTVASTSIAGTMQALSQVVMTKAMWANLKANIDGFFKMVEAAIGDFLDVIIKMGPKIGQAIASIFVTSKAAMIKSVPQLIIDVMPTIMKALDVLDKYAEPLGQKIVSVLAKAIRGASKSAPELVSAVSDLVGSLVGSISDELGKVDSEDLLNASKTFAIVGGLGVLFSKKFGQINLGLAAANMAKVGVLVTEMTGVIAILGGINAIPGVEWLLGKGGDLLGKLGEVIGKFVGGIAGGFSGQYAESSLPDIAKGLKGFADNIQGVDFDSIKKAASAMTAIADISKAIPRVGGLLQLLIGGKYLDLFGGDLQKLGPGIRTFADSVQGIDDDTVDKIKIVSKAMEAVGELSKSIPRRHGLAQVIAGAKDLGMFGDDLKPFAEGIQSLSSIDIDVDNVKKVAAIADTLEPLTDAMKSIERTGGVVGRVLHGWDPEHLNGFDNLGFLSTFLNEGLFGSNKASIQDFGDDIDALKKACEKLDGFPDIDASGIKSSMEALKSIGEVIDDVLDPTGGIIGRIMHGWDNKHYNMDNFDLISTFLNEGLFGNTAESIKAFGEQIDQFKILSNKLDGFDIDEDSLDKVNKVIPVVKKLSSMMKEIQKEQGPTGGAVGLGKWLLFGSGDEMSKIGAQLNEFSMQIQDVDTDKVATAVDAVKKIRNLVSGSKEGTAKVDNFDDFAKVNFSNIGNNIKQFADAVESIDFDDGSLDNAVSIVRKISNISAILSQNKGGVEAFDTFANVKFGGLGKQLEEFSKSASNIEPDDVDKMSTILSTLNKTASQMTGLDQLNELSNLHIGNLGQELIMFSGSGKDVNTDNINKIGGALLALDTAAGSMTNIEKIQELGNAGLGALGGQLQDFMVNIQSEDMKDVTTKVNQVGGALLALDMTAGSMTSIDKINQLSTIQLGTLGGQLMDFGVSLDGAVSADMTTKINQVGGALLALDMTAQSMTAIDKINQLSNIQLGAIGSQMRALTVAIGTDFNPDTVNQMGGALLSLDMTAQSMTAIDRINQLSTIQVGNLGTQMKTLCTSLDGLDTSKINQMGGALLALDMTAGNITNMDKLQSLNSLNFSNLATSLKSISDGTVDPSNIQSVCDALEKLNKAAGKLDPSVGDKVKKFTDGFKSLKDLNIKSDVQKNITDAFKDIKIPSDTGSKVAKQFTDSLKDADVSSAGKTLAKNAASGISQAGGTWQNKGKDLGNKFASGVKTGGRAATSAAKSMASKVASSLSGASKDAFQSGSHVGENFAAGIRSSIRLATSAASDMANAVAAYVHLSEPKLGPLKHLAVSGMHVAQNFASGMKQGTPLVGSAANGLAQSVADYIHHSTPKKGPLKGDDKWGSEVSNNFAKGLMSGLPNVRIASMTMAQAISSTMNNVAIKSITNTTKMTKKGTDQLINTINNGAGRVSKSAVNYKKVTDDIWKKTHKNKKSNSDDDSDPNEQFVSDLASKTEELKNRNQLSLKDELSMYQYAAGKVKKSANATKDAQKNADQAIYDTAEKYMERRKKQFGEYTVDETVFWSAIGQTVSKGSDTYNNVMDKMNESLVSDGEHMIDLRKKYLGEYKSYATEVWLTQIDLGKKVGATAATQEELLFKLQDAIFSDTEDAINREKQVVGDALEDTTHYYQNAYNMLKNLEKQGLATTASLEKARFALAEAIYNDAENEASRDEKQNDIYRKPRRAIDLVGAVDTEGTKEHFKFIEKYQDDILKDGENGEAKIKQRTKDLAYTTSQIWTDLLKEGQRDGYATTATMMKLGQKAVSALKSDGDRAANLLQKQFGKKSPVYQIRKQAVDTAHQLEESYGHQVISLQDIADLEDSAGQAFVDDAQNMLDTYRTWRDITPENFYEDAKQADVDFWESLMNSTQKGSAENLYAQQKYYESADALMQEYNSNVRSTASNLMSAFNLVSDTKFNDSASEDDFVRRAENAEAAISRYEEAVDRLKSRGILSQEALNEVFSQFKITDFKSLETLSKSSTESLEKINEAFTYANKHAIETSKMMWQHMIAGLDPALKENRDQIQTVMTNLFSVVNSAMFSDTNLKTLGAGINKLLGETIGSRTLQSRFDSNGNVLGKNLSAGLANGITSGGSAVADAMTSIVKGALNAGKKAADSHSPSKKTMQLGEYMGEGLVIGLKNWLSQVGVAGTDLTNEGLGGLSMKIADIVDAMGQDMDMAPTITPVLDLSNVEDGFDQYDKLLEAAQNGTLDVDALQRYQDVLSRAKNAVTPDTSRYTDALNRVASDKAYNILASMKDSYDRMIEAQNRLSNKPDTPTNTTSIGRVNINIYPRANQDANDIADSVIDRINNEITRKGKVYSA